jgi:hypothetical protein
VAIRMSSASKPSRTGSDMLKYAAAQGYLYEVLKGSGQRSTGTPFYEPIGVRTGRSGTGRVERPGMSYEQRDPAVGEQASEEQTKPTRNILKTVFGVTGSD